MTNTVKCPSGEPIEVDPWISVKDRLPEVNSWCLLSVVRDGKPIVITATFIFFSGLFHSLTFDLVKPYISKEITHWMPLPKPPKTDK